MRGPVISISERHRLPCRILIVDDHEIVRMGLRAVLARDPLFDVCAEAADGNEALSKVREWSPDLVILDLSIPLLNGFDTALAIRGIAPEIKILLYSVHAIPSSAQIVGADACVQKGTSTTELLQVIKRLMELS